MLLRFEQRLKCSPDVAFALASEPDRMNLWSTARVRLRALGDGGHPAGVGALRDVRLPRPDRVLHEVIEESHAPWRLVYRVVPEPPIASHRGEVTIEATADGSVVRWQVEASFSVPGVAALAERLLDLEMRKSLKRMATTARTSEPGRLPPRRQLDEASELRELIRAGEAIREEQRELADELFDLGDPRAWFTRAYQHVTELQLTACRAERFSHPAWVMRLLARFHQFYIVSLERSLHRREGAAEGHWQAAFDSMRRAQSARRGTFETMTRCVFRGMKAHIEDDLPRALAEVFVQHYASRCDYARFRADYIAMAPIFREAGERVVRQIPAWRIPVVAHVAMRLPVALREQHMHRNLYDIPRKRRQAFERGERLIELLQGPSA